MGLRHLTNIAEQKRDLRKLMLQHRDAIDTASRNRAQHALSRFADALRDLLPEAKIFSSYRAIGSEITPTLLERELAQRGADIALPAIVRKSAPLTFRTWQEGDPLIPGKWGILEPASNGPSVLPDVVLLPMLAFDAAGRRLGYGGGFYDRTLQELRTKKIIIAIGLAYPQQEVDAVPYDGYDQYLDYVLTPEGLRAFANYRMTE